MNKNLTEIVCVIDRSGSMMSIKDDAIGGFNGFIEAQKKVKGEAKLTLALFNHQYELVYNGVALDEVKLDDENFVPRGTTALLDAIGRTVDDVGARLAATNEAERPAQVIVAILTDGQENASKDYSQARIAEIIEHQQEQYQWEFIFLAANQDAFSTGRQLKMRQSNVANFSADSAGVAMAMKRTNEQVTRLRNKSRH